MGVDDLFGIHAFATLTDTRIASEGRWTHSPNQTEKFQESDTCLQPHNLSSCKMLRNVSESLPHERFGAAKELEAKLRTSVNGEIRFDEASRAL